MSSLNGRLLVTGAAGFIGSALVWGLNRRGHVDIDLCDLVSTEKKHNLSPLRFARVLTPEELRTQAIAGKRNPYSCIFHLGACSSTTERDLGYLLDNNFGFTRDLARWSLSSGTRFIYASSAATYGDGSQGMEDGTRTLFRLKPLNLYGYSKHLFDLYACTEGWLPHVHGLKYFNVFGPNENHKGPMRSVVHKAFEEIRTTGALSLFRSHRPDFADGHQRRDFLYVKDAVEMTLHLASSPDAPGGLYNLGSGTAHTWLELAGALFSSLGLPQNIRFIDMPEAIRDAYQYHTCADVSRLRSAGFRQDPTPLSEAVRDCVSNYLIPGRRLGEAGAD